MEGIRSADVPCNRGGSYYRQENIGSFGLVAYLGIAVIRLLTRRHDPDVRLRDSMQARVKQWEEQLGVTPWVGDRRHEARPCSVDRRHVHGDSPRDYTKRLEELEDEMSRLSGEAPDD